jgi:CheY-like chemotaxis protein
MHQVIMNLCTNAHHAMADEGGELQVNMARVDLGIEEASKFPDLQPGPYLKLTVSDTGHGMDAETVERIFDPYFTTKAKGKGAGLGLAVVHGIIKSYGGAVEVKSEIGKGTTFEVFLPRAAPELQHDAKETGDLQLGTERILFVDDEKILADLAENMLEYLGYQVVAKTDAVEALETFESEPKNYDLVITDMTMPKITGDRLAQKIKAIRSEIPIIVCSGYNEVLDKTKAKSMGISAYLMKPISLKNLSDCIREALEKADQT